MQIQVQSYFRLFIYKEMASQVMQLHITCCVLCLSLQVCFLRSFQKKLNLRGLILRDFSSLLSAFLCCLEIHSCSLWSYTWTFLQKKWNHNQYYILQSFFSLLPFLKMFQGSEVHPMFNYERRAPCKYVHLSMRPQTRLPGGLNYIDACFSWYSYKIQN